MPEALLKLLVKDKPLYNGKVREKGKQIFRGERNEVRADERQTSSGKLRRGSEDNYSRQGPTSMQS